MMVILLFFAGMAMIMYALFSSVSILPKLSNATKNMNNMGTYSSSTFYFDKIYFHESIETINKTDTCTSLITKQIVIADVIFKTINTPESCDIFINNKFVKHVVPYVPLCSYNCSKEIKLSIDINKQNLFKNHEIKLCCDSVCLKQELNAKCK